MNSLIKLEFEQKEIRTVAKDGELWFVAKDVFKILGLCDQRTHLEKLDDDEKGVSIINTLGGNQKVNVINESGLYGLTFLSRKTEAKRFRKWVTSEVLPSIRKHGGYIKPTATSEQITALMMEREHYKMLSEINEKLANTWKARSEYGERSNSNGLPKFLKRRGAWVADPRFKSSVILNFNQMTFSFAN